ncbi:MAG: hypothetical protein WC846_03775 [Candidatus Gracilibacteria bacterium]|jgi:hypothetical protein
MKRTKILIGFLSLAVIAGASGAYIDPKGAVSIASNFDGGSGLIKIDEDGQTLTLNGGIRTVLKTVAD